MNSSTAEVSHDNIDTIAAVATANGRAGIGIVRLSGPKAFAIGQALSGRAPEHRKAIYADFSDDNGNLLDQGLLLGFTGPHSFTGEDVVELQGHGSPVVMEQLLGACEAAGARRARPGEFSERAFLNDKLDLTQAEAIADLIDAGSAAAGRAALQSLTGVFSRHVKALMVDITALRVHLEAALDFPEEEIDFVSDPALLQSASEILSKAESLLSEANQGSRLTEGITIVLVGEPNVGKSSLINQLSGNDVAIVTDIPGTTRDLLHQDIVLDGMPIRVIDTAGLRHTTDPVEAEGVKRARAAMETADLCLVLMDDRNPVRPPLPDCADGLTTLDIHNKCDLSDNPPGMISENSPAAIRISAVTGDGTNDLKSFLSNKRAYPVNKESAFSARSRHIAALQRAQYALSTAKLQLAENHSAELAAEELRNANNNLGEIIGTVTSDDLLGEIFSSFCIGK